MLSFSWSYGVAVRARFEGVRGPLCVESGHRRLALTLFTPRDRDWSRTIISFYYGHGYLLQTIVYIISELRSNSGKSPLILDLLACAHLGGNQKTTVLPIQRRATIQTAFSAPTFLSPGLIEDFLELSEPYIAACP